MAWYRLQDLTLDSVAVEFLCGEGVVRGFLKTSRKGSRDYRFRLPTGHVRSVPEQYLLGWRPTNPDIWPLDLPEPMARAKPRKLETPKVQKPSDAPGEAQAAFGEGAYLGPAKQPPRTRYEAAARILRAIRTDDYQEAREDKEQARMGYRSAWPPEYIHASYVVAAWLRGSRTKMLPHLKESDYDDIHVDPAYLAAAGERWVPQARDVSDWEDHILAKWGKSLTSVHWRVLRWRAANPPYTFRQIGDREGKTDEWARQKYNSAIDIVWEAARG